MKTDVSIPIVWGARQLLMAGLLLIVCVSVVWASDGQLADSVIVKKAERKLYLIRGVDVVKSYDISLGLVPEGHKEMEGDFRTPEGRYMLEERFWDSHYFLSIRISYPNKFDQNRARKNGVDPGGRIMIHGRPNEPRYSDEYYRHFDWTDGCIAVSNTDMLDIWRLTTDNIPIDILP
jgi:murein L,D-transpeptidase YafK